MSLATSYETDLKHQYHLKLQAAGIPAKVAHRTPEQVTTASLLYWAAKSEALMDLGSLSQSTVEN